MNKLFPFLCIGLFMACSSEKPPLKLRLTHDQIVHAIVDMYSMNAALNLNDIVYRDSISNEYYSQFEKINGVPSEVIRSDLELLLQYPDTLVKLENRALDTLRVLLEKSHSTTPLVIGKN
ncbi:MAG: hypothetical protein LW630_04480 [Saprospiraceae bacterium]|nr:hypothetical protein [Saprospiraceae bacterium]